MHLFVARKYRGAICATAGENATRRNAQRGVGPLQSCGHPMYDSRSHRRYFRLSLCLKGRYGIRGDTA